MSQHKVLDVGAFYVATGNGHSKGSVVATKLARQDLGARQQRFGHVHDKAWART